MSEGKVKVGILISGRGSNMESIVRKAKADEIPAEVVVVTNSNRGGWSLYVSLALCVFFHLLLSGSSRVG